jgi:hypothetical protein
MKTSFDISEALLQQVKQLAKRRGTTTRSVVEEALMKLLAEAETGTPGFTLRDVSYGSGGMAVEFLHGGWERLRDELYPLPEPFEVQSAQGRSAEAQSR